MRVVFFRAVPGATDPPPLGRIEVVRSGGGGAAPEIDGLSPVEVFLNRIEAGMVWRPYPPRTKVLLLVVGVDRSSVDPCLELFREPVRDPPAGERTPAEPVSPGFAGRRPRDGVSLDVLDSDGRAAPIGFRGFPVVGFVGACELVEPADGDVFALVAVLVVFERDVVVELGVPTVLRRLVGVLLPE